MSIAVSAAALLLLSGDAAQAAPRPQTTPPAATQTAPRTTAPAAAPGSDVTRNLNSGPPRPAEYLAPAPTPEADDDEPAARPPSRSSAPATTTPPARSTTAPTTGASTTRPSTTAPARPTATPPAASAPSTTRPATTAPSTAPSTTRPSTTAPTTTAPATTTRPPTSAPATTRPSTSAPATSAPATTTRPPAAAPATAPRATAPAAPARPTTAAPSTAAPPAPGVTVLDAVAIDALPFAVDLPQGFEIVTGRPGPDFRIYTIRRGDRSYVMVYAGPASQFPIYSGDVVEAGGRASVITNEDGQRRALEHLFQRPDAPREVHVWTMSLEGADRALAERIAQSVDVR